MVCVSKFEIQLFVLFRFPSMKLLGLQMQSKSI